MTESTLNRLTAFLAPPSVRRIVSQAARHRFLECMNRGDIILLNLNPGHTMSEQNARLLGTLFVNALFANARTRGVGKRPFYLVVDEAYRYLTEDVEKILDEGRKYGLHLVLAHQRIGQLEAAGENILSAVMGMARTKIVFGGLTPEEAEIMESFLYMGTYDLQRVKPELTTPVTTRHEVVWLRNPAARTATSYGVERKRQRDVRARASSFGHQRRRRQLHVSNDGRNRVHQRARATIPTMRTRKPPTPRVAHRTALSLGQLIIASAQPVGIGSRASTGRSHGTATSHSHERERKPGLRSDVAGGDRGAGDADLFAAGAALREGGEHPQSASSATPS